MSKLVVLAALVCLVSVGARAQDVTNDNGDTNVRAVSTSLGEPAAASSKPAARPASLFANGPGLDLFFGYAYLSSGYPESSLVNGDCGDICGGRSNLSGYAFASTWWLNDAFGMTFDFSGNNGSPNETAPNFCDELGTPDSISRGSLRRSPAVSEAIFSNCTQSLRLDQDFYSFLFGPTVAHRLGKVKVFAHGLVGVSRADITALYSPFVGATPEIIKIAPNTGVSAAFGGGADYFFTPHVAWRIMQLDYIWSHLNQCAGSSTFCSGSVNNVRLSTGFEFHLGGGNN